uniref:HAT C-terminal dimerisation domain-containing protein n=1 Tax=Anopheles minimus TaxID=112268 RepID=A0A182VSM5_9DIPT
MLERFLKNKIPIVSCLASIKFKLNLSDFFDLATKEILGEKTVTISKVGILISTLNFEMSKAHEGVILTDETARLIGCLKKKLKKRFDDYNAEFVNQAILLDPRFKDQQFLGAKFEKTLVSLKEKLMPDNTESVSNNQAIANNEEKFKGLLWRKWRALENNDRTASSDRRSAATLEIERYLQEEGMDSMDDPLGWWKSKYLLYPRLYDIVQKPHQCHVNVFFRRQVALSRVEQAPDEACSNIPSNTLEEYVGIQRYFPNIRPPSAEMKRDLDETLLIMICKEYYPFSMVEGKHFQTFVKKLHPTYELPSRKTLTNALLLTI